MQYLRVVMFEFGPRSDGLPGTVQWPHVSINTLNKLDEEACLLANNEG
jgi:hypothetical protein